MPGALKEEWGGGGEGRREGGVGEGLEDLAGQRKDFGFYPQ